MLLCALWNILRRISSRDSLTIFHNYFARNPFPVDFTCCAITSPFSAQGLSIVKVSYSTGAFSWTSIASLVVIGACSSFNATYHTYIGKPSWAPFLAVSNYLLWEARNTALGFVFDRIKSECEFVERFIFNFVDNFRKALHDRKYILTGRLVGMENNLRQRGPWSSFRCVGVKWLIVCLGLWEN